MTSLSLSPRHCWQWLAYHHQAAEGSLYLIPLLFGAFWLSHRSLLRKSRKPFLRTTGRIIEALLLICLASGLLLVLHGTPGDGMGNLASWAHWLSALALTPLVLRHAWRWTILKWRT